MASESRAPKDRTRWRVSHAPPVDAVVSVVTDVGKRGIFRGVPCYTLYRATLTTHLTNARGTRKRLPTLRGVPFMSRGAMERQSSAVWHKLPWLPEAISAEIVL